MSQKIKDMIEQRNRVVVQAREILDKAETEKRSLTAEEEGKWNELIKEQDKLSKSIEQESRQLEIERSLAQESFRATPAGKETATAATGDPRSSEEYRSAFYSLIKNGPNGITGDEVRALQADQQTAGGFLLAPLQLIDGILKEVDNILFIRQKATKYPVASALSLGIPTIESDADDAEWTAEVKIGSEDTGLGLGRRELKPHKLSKLVKISNTLIAMSPNVEPIVTDRVSYKMGVAQEKGFMIGNGINQALGLFVASNDGIPTSRDISAGNSATAITFDGLKESKYSLKPQYLRTAEWIFHRDAIKMLSKIKDGEGDYIWEPSTVVGDPDKLLGSPFNMSEYAPNTFTANQYVGIYGDLSFYWIADAMEMRMQRLVELFAGTDQIGLIARMHTDGMPVLPEAFSRVKLGS